MIMQPSPFGDKARWISENDLAFAVRDGFPISKGHTLILPRRNVSNLFDLTEEEILACWELIQHEKTCLDAQYAPHGYNVGVNVEPAGGQSVSHAHIHLIPRYYGDHPSPRGGVRAVIPGKQNY